MSREPRHEKVERSSDVGIREKLNENPGITTGITVGIIVIALGAIVWQLFGGGDNFSPVTQMYYTTDDGQTYFADDANRISPFEKDGKEAVRCYVFKCSDGKPFVAYLERLSKEARAKYEAALKAEQAKQGDNPGAIAMDADMIAMEWTEVKRPGDSKWVLRRTREGEQIVLVTCPDGNNQALELVVP